MIKFTDYKNLTKKKENWSNKWGFRFSVSKTKAMIFTSRKKLESRNKVKIYNQDIVYVNQFKFLGLIFDNKFTWNDHVNYIEAYCNKRINLLKFVLGTKWGANSFVQISLYKLYTMIYGPYIIKSRLWL